MTNSSRGKVFIQRGIAVLDEDGVHVCDVKGLSRSDVENEENARRIVACINACDGYTTAQLEGLTGGNVKREVTHFADKLCDAENRYLKAERLRDNLLAALKDLLEHEGTVVYTGIGELPSDELEEARKRAQAVIQETESVSVPL